MKHPGASFDVTAVTETIVDSLRARLPQIVSAEVAKQLRGQVPRLYELECMAARTLAAQRTHGVRKNDEGAP
jgi:hypothetical protein